MQDQSITQDRSSTQDRYDVIVLGAGLAGLTLTRQLLLETDKTVLLLEKRAEVPGPHQKVGESSVQVGGNYFSKVLDLEEHLLTRHFMKYNLRFYWKSAGRDNRRFEDFSQEYIRTFSNVASYQLDRNVLEAEILRRNLDDPRCTFRAGVDVREVDLEPGEGPHRVVYAPPEDDAAPVEARASWVVDTTGRRRLLAGRGELKRPNTIRHGAFFWWVDGLLDIEKLTDRPRSEIRRRPQRREFGHLPLWMATNHFCGEGFWFWVIPLQGKTSLGLVFDKEKISHRDVFTVEKATAWVSREFPLFAAELAKREVLDFGGYKDFSHDCGRTLSSERWAMAGEAGRFSDPLYSPGSDLIAIYNTLIVDAVKTDDTVELQGKCALYEPLMRAVYSAYEPSYATSYDALGDPEVFALKYTWELTIYFGFYVFPFLNDLFTEKRFLPSFLRGFSRLGPINRNLQQLLSDFYQWKKIHLAPLEAPVCFDFTELEPLRRAEKTFYEIGVTVEEARRVLDAQLANLDELAAFLITRVAAVVLDDESLLADRRFAADLDPATVCFDPDAFARHRDRSSSQPLAAEHAWSFDTSVMQRFSASRRAVLETVS